MPGDQLVTCVNLIKGEFPKTGLFCRTLVLEGVPRVFHISKTTMAKCGGFRFKYRRLTHRPPLIPCCSQIYLDTETPHIYFPKFQGYEDAIIVSEVVAIDDVIWGFKKNIYLPAPISHEIHDARPELWRGFDIYESLYMLFYTQTAKFERQAIFTHKAQRLGACGSHIPSLRDPG